MTDENWQNFPDIDNEPLYPDETCNAEYSTNGLCPCCGVEVNRETVHEGGHLYVHVDNCPSCGWESVPLYE